MLNEHLQMKLFYKSRGASALSGPNRNKLTELPFYSLKFYVTYIQKTQKAGRQAHETHRNTTTTPKESSGHSLPLYLPVYVRNSSLRLLRKTRCMLCCTSTLAFMLGAFIVVVFWALCPCRNRSFRGPLLVVAREGP